MNATATRPHPPLVVAVGKGVFAWIQDGVGYFLDSHGAATWHPFTDADGLVGTVLNSGEVARLVATHGRPTP